jgi:hypothetical protein
MKGKSLLLIAFLGVALQPGLALEFQSPSDQKVADPFEVNVTGSDENQVSVTLEGEDVDFSSTSEVDTPDGYGTTEFDVGGTDSGDYSLTAEAVNDSGDVKSSIEKQIFVDAEKPSVERSDEYRYVNEGSEIQMTVSDDQSAVTDLEAESFSVDLEDGTRDNVCGPGGVCTVSFDFDRGDAAQGDQFTVSVEASDFVGNTYSRDISYVYDSEFEADKPEFTVEDAEDGIVQLDSDVEVDVEVQDVEDEQSDIKVRCLVDGEEVDTSGWDNEESFSCSIPEDEVNDEAADISVEAVDRAGNTVESDERSISFDSSEPDVEEFELVQEYNTFRRDFEARFEADDSLTGIDRAEYLFDIDTDEGDGYEVQEEGEFKVDTSDISRNGSKTVYLRVQDGSGRWSEYESVEFRYFPESSETLRISTPQDFELRAGSSTDYNIEVENTGELLVESVVVTVSSRLFEKSVTLEELEGGDSETVSVSLSPNESQTGRYEVSVSSQSPDEEVTGKLTVRASEDQRSRVRELLENLSSANASISGNLSDISRKASEQELERTSSSVQTFQSEIRRIEAAVENGSYYQALPALETAEQRKQEALESLRDVENSVEARETKSTILNVLLAGVLITVVILYAHRRDQKSGIPDLDELRNRLQDTDSASVSERLRSLDMPDVSLPDSLPEISLPDFKRGKDDEDEFQGLK